MLTQGFTGGLEPGGLKSQSEICLLICYVLASVKEPLAKNDIVMILQDTGLANYFEAASALADVLAKGNADQHPENPDLCIANENSIEISRQLQTILSPAVRDRALSAALQLLAMAKRERDNKVEIVKKENGYDVTCHISGGKYDLMSFTLRVPDQHQARLVKKNFYRSPEITYQVMLCLMTGNKDYLETLMKEF